MTHPIKIDRKLPPHELNARRRRKRSLTRTITLSEGKPNGSRGGCDVPQQQPPSGANAA